jgi:hypothetical protein
MEIQEFSREGEAPVLWEAEARGHVSGLGESSLSMLGSLKKCWIHVANERLVLRSGHVHRCRVSMEGLEG